MTRAEKAIAFIEKYCRVPEGDLIGQPVVLIDFERQFIIDVYDNPHQTDTAILSMARKNAKTALIAMLVLVHVAGPEAILNSRIVSGAMSREQAAEVYNYAYKMVLLNETLSRIIKPIASKKILVGLPMNVEYQAISAEAKTAHGKSPIVAILDEVGQIRGPQDDFVDAITTAQGAYDNPLLIYISTQASSDADLFSILIDDALEKKPPKTVCHLYAADEDCDVMDEEQWKKANPALGVFRSEKDMRKQAEKAARMPSFENTFRNLNLNQRVEILSPFVSRSAWTSCSAEPPPMKGFQLYGGLDLSGKLDLTSAVFTARASSQLFLWPFFWTPEDGLRERAKRDRQPYDVWVKQGFIRTVPGASIDYEFVIRDLIEILDDNELIAMAFDRWRIDIFKRDCERAEVEFPLTPFGQGFKDMSPAIDLFEEYIVNGELCHGANPVLTMCAANAIISKDPAGNRKFDKSKDTGRIDGMVASAMSIGSMTAEIEESSVYEEEGKLFA